MLTQQAIIDFCNQYDYRKHGCRIFEGANLRPETVTFLRSYSCGIFSEYDDLRCFLPHVLYE